MGICEDIAAARKCGKVRCGVTAGSVASVSDVAATFGLQPAAEHYREIDGVTARLVLVRLLGHDMAYDKGVVPTALADELAGHFLAQFGPGARYFTNGDWQLPDAQLRGWEAVAVATFDGGVLVLDARQSGCLWVEDED
jgi:hypothetical protein